jgi:hypothetical protein
MDRAEYLIAILRNAPHLTEEEALNEYRLHLQDIEEHFSGYENLVAAFDESQQWQRKPMLTAA